MTALLTSIAVGTVGTRLTAVAIPWLVLVTTQSPVKAGLVSGAEMLPYVLSAVFSAPLQDRLGDRRTSIYADFVSAGVVAAIAAGHRVGFGVLLALVAVGGAVRAAGNRSKATLFRPVIDMSGASYARITSGYEGVKRTAGLIGTAVGGVVIALLGPEGALGLNAVAFALAALIVVSLVPDPPRAPASPATIGEASAGPATRGGKQTANGEPPTPYWSFLRSGYNYFRSDRLLPSMTSMLFVTNLFNQASATIFIPLWVLTVLHSPMALGAVAGAFAAGAIVGNVVFTAIAPYVARYPALVAGYLIGGMPRFLVLAYSDDLLLVSTVLFLCGVAMCSVNPTIGALIYHRVPGPMLARTNGILGGASYAGLPLGGLVGGIAVTTLGYTNGVLLAAAAYFLATLSPIVRAPVWREIDDARTHRRQLDPTRAVPWGYALTRWGRGLRVRLSYIDGTWMVRARRGPRELLAPTPVAAKVAMTGLSQLSSDPVHAAVAELLTCERAATELLAHRTRDHLAARATMAHLGISPPGGAPGTPGGLPG